MSEYIPVMLGGIIGALSGVIGSYVIVKRTMNTDNLYGKLDEITEEIANDTRMQQKIYGIGALLGQGLAAGSGIKSALGGKGGKFRFNDLISMGAQAIFGKLFPNQQQPEQQQLEEQIGFAKTAR